MCGLAGFLNSEADTTLTATARMASAQRHRGPDADGVETYPFGRAFLGLGHRRLSILDLSPLGRQPMTDPATGNVIVFNGEIYNFRTLQQELQADGVAFRSQSDTEVLLVALSRWGVPDTLRRLEGMFAFAFLNVWEQVLTLARDPLGIKPLYLADTVGGGVAFASEVRALLASGLVSREIDRRGVAGFLAYGAVQHPFTLFTVVRSLPPGSYQQFAATETNWRTEGPKSFWRFPATDSTITADSSTATVRTTLTDAVCDHLIADVPVGVFLSAGLDSTIIAGLAAAHTPGLRAFTVGFSDLPDTSEVPIAAETAKRFGLEHVPVDITTADAEGAVERWLAAMDQPSIDGLNTFVISEAVRRRGIKVALSGLGADELFGGYPSFRDVPRLMRLRRGLGWLPSRVRGAAAGVLAVRKPPTVRRKLTDMLRGSGDLSALYFQRRQLLSDADFGRLGIDADGLGLTSHYQHPNSLAGFDAADPTRAISELESRFYQGNMLLRDTDVMGMAHGLELRVPFLDRRLLDLGHAIPGGVRLPAGRPGKHLLRRAFADLLPDAVASRPKTGFTLPVARWMRTSLKSRCDSALATLKEIGLVEPKGIDALTLEFFAKPDSPSWSRVLALVALGDLLGRSR